MDSDTILYPIRRVCFTPRQAGREPILLAAVGHTVLSLSLEDKHPLGCWSSRDEDGSDESSGDEDGERPNKRRRVTNGVHDSISRRSSEASEASIEILAEGKIRQKGERRKPKIPDLSLPNISHVIATSEGRYVVVITVEDKSVRVLRLKSRGRLKQLTSRALPKRLCALALTRDEKTILVADKFGDVYSLPLHPTPGYQPKAMPDKNAGKEFKPSASKLTVHTQGNLEALRQQQLQKQVQTRKECPNFEHKLLLGHVSLLTDLIIAEGAVEGRNRSFILTADRDEHIRVSRGIPQTHIIQTYCMGHTEFVSKLCISPWQPDLLVAGNGEASLRIYEWQTGKQVNEVKLIDLFKVDISSTLVLGERNIENLAVSGIWPISFAETPVLVVALEGLPLLFTLHHDGSTWHRSETLRLDGNLLDVAVLLNHQIVVSVDNIHEAGSMKMLRRSSDSMSISPLKCYQFDSHALAVGSVPWTESETKFDANLIYDHIYSNGSTQEADAVKMSGRVKFADKPYSVVGEFVYGLENLRKKKGRAAEEEEDGTAMSTPATEGETELDMSLES